MKYAIFSQAGWRGSACAVGAVLALAAGGGAITAAALPRPAAASTHVSTHAPARAATAAAQCDQVSAKAVSKAVGHTVPRATVATTSLPLGGGLVAKVTECVYGSDATPAASARAVGIGYVQLNKAASLSTVDQAFEALLPEPGRVAAYRGLGAPASYVVSSDDGVTFEAMAAVKGDRVVVAGVGTSARESVVAGVAKLAVKAYL